MFRAVTSLRVLPRAVAHSTTPALLPRLATRYSTAPPVPSPPSTPPPALQRPQKHKAKKSKAHKQPLPSSTTRQPLGASSSLLPVGLRTPSSLRDARQSPDGRVIALTTAESYDTAALLKNLQARGLLDGAVNLVGESILLPRWSPASSTYFDAEAASAVAGTSGTAQQEVGEVYIFESGTIVLWGLSMQAAETFLRKVIRGGQDGFVEEGRYAEPETEVLDYWVGKGSTRMSGDSIHLTSAPSTVSPSSSAIENGAPAPPSKDLLERLAFSAGMARVTKLGVYEEQFDEFAEGVAGIPKLLQSGSEAPVKKTDIIKRVGTLHAFRQKLNLEDENLLDEPEFLWEDADLHGHYTAVCKALEFESRLTTLNDRVDYAFSLQTTLMELLNAQTSHRLEWIIIILIAFEITLVILREGLPFLSSEEEDKKKKESHA
ncbi:hypothetical protein JCM6882_008985 [Rhodosporidiobolus microsporus]